MATKKHNDGWNDAYLRHDEALALVEEINARPGWHADEPYINGGGGALWAINVTYTPQGWLSPWGRHGIQSQHAWEGVRDREERMARERQSAAMNCHMVVQCWIDEETTPAGIKPGRWFDFAYTSMRQYGAMIGHWMHTDPHNQPGRRVRVVLISGRGEYGDLMDSWPNQLDCGTDEVPCKHAAHDRGQP